MFVDIDKLEEKFALLQSDIFNNFLSLEKDLSVGDEDICSSDIAKGHVKIISEGTVFEKAIASFSMIKSSNLPNTLLTEGTKIPDNSLVMGSPGKVKKEVDENLKIILKGSAEHYVENGKRFKSGLKEEN